MFPVPVGGGRPEMEVDYYIHAEDNSGRAEGMPRTEPEAWYSFTLGYTTVDADTAPAGPASLHANYPNPFNPNTTFSFELHHEDHVLLQIFDVEGRLVRTLCDEPRPAGRSEFEWDGRDEKGRALPSGVYLYRLSAAGIQYSRRRCWPSSAPRRFEAAGPEPAAFFVSGGEDGSFWLNGIRADRKSRHILLFFNRLQSSAKLDVPRLRA